MPKMTTREIRERTIELLQSNAASMRYIDLVRTIAVESPETPYNTIFTQVAEVPARHSDLVFRPQRGLFQLRSNADLAALAQKRPPTLPRTSATLKSLGFAPAGTWTLDGPHLRCDFFDHAERGPVLYTFVVAGEVMYVGKSARPLGKRLGHYGRPGPSQLTNLRVNARIRDVLAQEGTVGVWTLVDWQPLEHCGIPINVAAGIEDALIARLAPPWNGRAGRMEALDIRDDLETV